MIQSPKYEPKSKGGDNEIERERRKGLMTGIVFIGAIAGGVLGTNMLIDKYNKSDLQHEDIVHTGASEEFTPAAKKFSIMYEGQQQPGCFGGIEKVTAIINSNGEIRGVSVICKPDALEPAK
jgi:hypothetical protein